MLSKVTNKFTTKPIYINVAKGFNQKTLKTWSPTINQLIKGKARGLVTLIGPSFAEEVFKNKITIVNAVTDDLKIANETQKIFNTKYFKCIPIDDVKGAETISALKNVMAIGSGIMYAQHSSINTRSCILAQIAKEIFYILKVMGGKLETLYQFCGIGDIYLTAMNEIYNNISEAILKSTAVLNITGKVIPVTLDEITICAELNDGTTIKQKEQIPGIVAKKFEKINRIYISPSNCRPAPGVIEAIEDADVIIMGPGSLYTNVLPNLLVKNVSKAIKDSKAMRFYISNIMTEPGQTDNYTLSDHFKAINEHVGTDIIDYCLADTGEIVPEYIRKYNKEGSEPVEIDDKNLSAYNIKVIERNLSCIKNEKIRHNSDVIAGTIIEMICNDLKFHDMQNNTEYLLLQSVLKDYKKNLDKNIKRTKKKKTSKDNIKMTSKFKEKYNDRVKSIQNTENKISENRRIASEIEKMEKEKMNSYTEYNYESSRRASGLKERRSHGRRNK